MEHEPALLIIADLPPGYRLTNLASGDNPAKFHINDAKFVGLEKVEVVMDGMTFALTPYTAAETQRNLEATSPEHVFSKMPPKSCGSIGITLGHNIIDAKHISAVNRALLQLAQFIGEQVSAFSIVWRAANLNVDFAFFTETVEQYVRGGPFPVLVQVAISQNDAGIFQTSGLHYFCGQEVELSVPLNYNSNEAIKRLVRIAHDVATNGSIDNAIHTEGFGHGETISFTPKSDGTILGVTIAPEKANQLS